MKRVAFLITLVAAIAAGISSGVEARNPGFRPRAAKLTNDVKIDINNIAMYVTNQGSFAWDIPTGNSGLEFPRGSGKTAVFASGLWIGGQVNGETRVVVAEYSHEYQPGPMLSDGSPADPDLEQYRVYKISKGDGPSNPDWANWPVGDGAPVDENGDPLVLGDQTIWTVYNDANPLKHTNDAGQTTPLGIEVQQTTFAFNVNGPLGNVVFISFKLINKGGNLIENTYVSLWSDPDLGQADDDLVGCDVETSLAFCYNATNSDNTYGTSPPALGYDFFKGPIGDDGVELPMTSFNKYINGTDPHSPSETYNYMKGIDPDGSTVDHTDPESGAVTAYVVSGDPVAGTGWIDTNPSDRRFMLSSGPFTFAPGDTQEVIAAIIVAGGQDRLSSLTALRFFDSAAQQTFDNDFVAPSPPASPKVSVSSLGDRNGNGRIILTWELDSETAAGSYPFEGYNVYQGAAASGPWTRIATYDEINGLKIVFDDQFDESSGIVISRPAQFGNDGGVQHYIEVEDDKLLGGRLVTNRVYYYAVTAYSVDETGTPTTLETAINVLGDGRTRFLPLSTDTELAPGIMPLPPLPGTTFDPVTADAVATHTAGGSDGSASVTLVDPTRITGDTYEVRFRDDAGTVVWDLVNVSGGGAILEGLPVVATSAEAAANPVADGLLVSVLGPPNGMKDWDIPTGERWYTWAGADWGAEGFNGAMTGDANTQWFAPTSMPASRLRNVELRFTSVNEGDGEDQYKPIDLTNENVSMAYRYLRGAGGDPPAPEDLTTSSVPYDFSPYIVNTSGPGVYPFQDRVPIMLSAWDIESSPPRRLEVGFLENNQPGGLVNGAYGPAYNATSNVAGSGPREWLWIYDLDYTDPDVGENSQVLLDNGMIPDGPVVPFMYIVFAARRVDARFPQDGDTFLLSANHVNSPDDVFSFSTTGGVFGDEVLAVQDLDKVLAVPNPYLGRSAYESSSLARVVRFTNLPGDATIRLFTLAGDLVRTIMHNNGMTTDEWNLKSDQGILVASGIYIAHIQSTIGTKVLKLAVFMEAETLGTF